MPQAGSSPEELRRRFDEELQRFLQERRKALPDARPLIEEIERALRAGGKRLRPALCYWGYRASGSPHGEEILRVSAALELLHTFAVVHDDIMDSAEQRRGEPTTFAVHGPKLAILVGDLALVLADDLFFSSGFAPEQLLRAFDAYSRMRQEVIAGQMLDLDHERTKRETSWEEALHVARLKSGRYSVEEPLAIGAQLGRADDDLLESLATVGRPFGIAFQLNDDLLGSFGEPEQTGKSVDADIRQGKRNLLFALALEGLEEPARSEFLDRWGAPDLADADIARLRGTLESSRARARAQTFLGDFRSEALAALEAAGLDADVRAALVELVEVATNS